MAIDVDEENVPLVLRKHAPSLNNDLRNSMRKFVRAKDKKPEIETDFDDQQDDLHLLATATDIDYDGKDFYRRDRPFTSILPREVFEETLPDKMGTTPKMASTLGSSSATPGATPSFAAGSTKLLVPGNLPETPKTPYGNATLGLSGMMDRLGSRSHSHTTATNAMHLLSPSHGATVGPSCGSSKFGSENPLVGLPRTPGLEKKQAGSYHYTRDPKYVEIKKKVEFYFLPV